MDIDKNKQPENLKENENNLNDMALNEDALDQVSGGSKTDIKTLLDTIVKIITK